MATPPRTEITAFYLFCIVIAVIAYQSFAGQFPFYFMWDMDLTYVFDSILIQSQQLPDHFNHPGFGAYLFYKWSFTIGQYLGLLTVSDLASLQSAVHPILAIVPTINFFRAHTAFIAATLATLLLFIANLNSVKFRFWHFILIAANCILLPSLFYQSSMIRSELFAIVFWILAALSAKTAASNNNKQVYWIIISGLFAGLAYLTKLQVLLFLPLLFVFYHLQNPEQNLDASDHPALAKIAIFNAIFFPVLILAAAFRSIDGETFTNSYPLNIVGVSFTIIPILILSALKKWLPFPAQWRRELAWPIYFLMGFAIAFFFHFLLFPTQPALALKYLLINAKMVFFRDNYQTVSLLSYAWLNLKSIVIYNPTTFVCFLLTSVLAFFNANNRREQFFYALGILITFLILTLGIRPILRDTLWAEIIFTFWFLLILPRLLVGNHRPSTYLAYVMLIALPISNSQILSNLPLRIQSAYANYGWQPKKIFDGMFHYRQMQYANIMSEFYPENSEVKKTALQNTNSAELILNTAKLTVPSQSDLWKRISVLSRDFSIWQADKSWKIDSYSEALNAVFTLDPNNSSKCSPMASLGANEISPINCKQGLLLHTRNDLNLFIFSENASLKDASQLSPTNKIIVVKKGGAKKELRGYLLKSTAAIDFTQFQNPIILVQFKYLNNL